MKVERYDSEMVKAVFEDVLRTVLPADTLLEGPFYVVEGDVPKAFGNILFRKVVVIPVVKPDGTIGTNERQVFMDVPFEVDLDTYVERGIGLGEEGRARLEEDLSDWMEELKEEYNERVRQTARNGSFRFLLSQARQ